MYVCMDGWMYVCVFFTHSSLGILNTRLIKAYCDFDERVGILIRVLKCWAREHGLLRSQFNSYALSLMMIFALQHSSPPVLPCLQKLGPWPKNMEWHGQQHHPLLENDMDYELVKPAMVHFIPPESLQRSLNTQDTGE